jgi:hypothetical protein
MLLEIELQVERGRESQSQTNFERADSGNEVEEELRGHTLGLPYFILVISVSSNTQ